MSEYLLREFPERLLMSELSDLLGIRHFTTSRGGTVRRDFLEEAAWAMGVGVPVGTTKEDLIRLVWERAQGAPMPEDRLSPGGTVTNLVLQEVIEGVLRNDIFGFVAEVEEQGAEEVVVHEDERRRAIREVAVREGQTGFRRRVLEAYGATCAITGADVPAALEAAHIAPYRGPRSHSVNNGLCLRSDIHALFDRGLLAVDERDLRVIISPVLAVSREYSHLDGVELTLPQDPGDRPSESALRAHREWSELAAAG